MKPTSLALPTALPVHPWHMLAGLGVTGRDELCGFLASFQDASLLKLAADRFQDFAGSRKPSTPGDSAYGRRLDESRAHLSSGPIDNAALRLMLWTQLCQALDCAPALPLSLRSCRSAGADVAHRTSSILAATLADAGDEQTIRRRAGNLYESAKRGLGLASVPPFASVVTAEAARMLGVALEEGRLDAQRRAALVEAFHQQLAQMPPELRGASEERALALGDAALVSLLAGGGGLAATGLAVEAAGIGAYILAAQASAFIPLVSGKAAVSLLFVLSNPLFIVPTLIGGGWWATRTVEGQIKARLAAGLAVLLALRGMSAGQPGLQACLDSFRAADVSRPDPALRPCLQYRTDVRQVMGGGLPPSAGPPPGVLAHTIVGQPRAELERMLFPSPDATPGEVAAVGALTLGDVLYAACSIDPKVVVAADFSRTEDLADLFRFGAFAERASEMSGDAMLGAYNNLRGYVAEQLVAVQLFEKGHQVSFPDTSNNPGFDLLVDGDPFQVKCLTDISGLAEHFRHYPDICVVANADLAEPVLASAAPWADQVMILEGFDYAAADSLLREAIDAGADLMSLDVPYFAGAVLAARHAHGWWKGSVALADLPYEVAVDGAVRGTLTVAGGLTGKALGFLLFGPAGAVVFAGVGGVLSLLGSGKVRAEADRLLSKAWLDQLDEASHRLVEALLELVQRRETELKRKLSLLGEERRDEVRWAWYRMLDDKVFLAEATVRLKALKTLSPLERVRMALSTMHEFALVSHAVRREIRNVADKIAARPKLGRDTLAAAARQWRSKR